MSKARYHDAGEVLPEIAMFLRDARSIVLATRDDAGETQPSYAPFVSLDENDFHVYVSELNQHTRNLRGMDHVSVMVIEDEANTQQIFVRRRMTLRCAVSRIERDSAQWCKVLDAFQARFGDVMDLMRPLQDFQLFRFLPTQATFVKGFGQAFEVGPEDLQALASLRANLPA